MRLCNKNGDVIWIKCYNILPIVRIRIKICIQSHLCHYFVSNTSLTIGIYFGTMQSSARQYTKGLRVMKGYRLVIVDSEKAYVDGLASYLSENSDLEVLGTAYDGIGACRVIESTRPDIVLMGMTLQHVDGISLLKYMQKRKLVSVAICLLDCCTTETLDVLRNCGVDYCLFRSVDYASIANVITEYADAAAASMQMQLSKTEVENEEPVRQCVHEIMRQMGFSSRYTGCCCIEESVMLAMETPTILHNLRSGLYPILARKFNSTPASVERNMRTAIAAANSNGRLSEYIGEAPTNKNCIQYTLRQVKMRQ